MKNTALDILDLNFRLIVNDVERRKIENQIEGLRKKCSHEIIVTTKETVSKKIEGMKIRSKTTCLICEKHLAPRKYMPKELIEKMNKAIKIDFNKYDNLPESFEKDGYDILKRYYFLEKAKNPELSDYEIGEILLEKISEMK